MIDVTKAMLDPTMVFTDPNDVVANVELTRDQKIQILRRWWSAPTEWSGLNVSAWSAIGPLGRCFRVPAVGNPGRYEAGRCCSVCAIAR